MGSEHILGALWNTIQARKEEASAATSYTKQLLADPPKIRRKIAEEAHELNEAHFGLQDGKDSKEHLVEEAADLLYHCFVLLASAGVSPDDVYGVLKRRHKPTGSGLLKLPKPLDKPK
jgi:phosphoribosyl-ATP pyrophosphohydrolase